MYIQNLELTSYRNYDHAELQFENKVNVIIGENAQGKTNLMEAIYVLSMAKSHRTSNDKELIRWDKDYAKIEGRVMKQNGAIPMRLVISKKGKKGKVNHIEQQKLSQYVGAIQHHYVRAGRFKSCKGKPSSEKAVS
nr:AAA family ATPase [Bacillus subtilis]